jgi:non-specific serine/threonine protein kinase
VEIELAVSPTGRISIQANGIDNDVGGDKNKGKATQNEARRNAQLARSFHDGNGAGLFELAADRLTLENTNSLSPGVRYWRGFAGRFLDQVCHLPDGPPESIGEISALTEADLASLILNVPPMSGGEYVSRELLSKLWTETDVWFRDEFQASKQSLSEFLQHRAPLRHQVGRVCFHLAENRRDPDYPFAFLATYAPTTLANEKKIQYQPLSKALQEYAGAKNKNALIKLLSPIQSASESSELLRQLVDSGDIYEPLAWTPPEAYQFLRDVPVMEQNAITVRLPDWWKKRVRPRVGITIGDTKQKKFDTDGMLDFRMQVALGDEELTPSEFQALLDGDEGLVLIKGQWVEVDRERLQQALQHWKAVEEEAVDGLSFSDGMRLLAGAPADLGDEVPEIEERDWSFVDAGEWLGQILSDMRSPGQLDSALPGKALKATLREYQVTGVNWLAFLSNLGLGACLADDMGLGKTIQVISLLLNLKKKKFAHPSLLVLPASLVGNWKSEIEKFAPTLSMRFAHSSQATKEELAAMAKSPASAFKNVDVVLTTYGTLLRQSWLLDMKWQLAVLDEAQAIKNPSARQTKCVKHLKTASRIALTGTPVENRLGDLWSLFDFLCPGLLGSPTKFKKFIKALEQRTTDQYAPLRRLVGPYILRRLKTDKSVISDLPEKTEVTAYCGLSKRQAVMYTKLVKELAKTLKDREGIQRRGVVLAYLMRFKQVCNHPSQLLGTGDFNGKDSGKFLRLVEICDEIASRQEKVLVFTQFREMADPISKLLANVFGRSGLVLHGGTPVRRRKELVDEFQQDDGPPFFVLSLKAGGTGLNLTAASHVVHFDRWWNPAVENQATDRAFRIGQKRNVLVHKFVCQGTLEERIDQLIAEKKQLAADVLEGGGEQMLTEMSNAELISMVSLDVDRVNL